MQMQAAAWYHSEKPLDAVATAAAALSRNAAVGFSEMRSDELSVEQRTLSQFNVLRLTYEKKNRTP
jgi:hypothetical protein